MCVQLERISQNNWVWNSRHWAFQHMFQHLITYYLWNDSPHSVPIIKRVIKWKYINHLSFKIFRCKPWNICAFMVWPAVSKQNWSWNTALPLFYSYMHVYTYLHKYIFAVSYSSLSKSAKVLSTDSLKHKEREERHL